MKVIAAIVLALSCCSCATLNSSKEEKIIIESNPPGISIYEQSTFLGTTPFRGSLDKRIDHQLNFKKDGYFSQTKLVKSIVSDGWVMMDILYTAGIGLLIDGSNEKWRTLDLPPDGHGSNLLDVYLEEDTTAVAQAIEPYSPIPISVELEHLFKLKQDGALTDDEYQKAKATLLK